MDKENNPAPENDSGDKGQEEKPTTFTQEQVNDIVSKRLAEANSKAEKKLKDEVRERRADAKDALSDRNIDTDLVDFVIDIDEDKTNSNIDKLEKAFNKAVEAGVKAKLAGTSPEDYGEGTKPKTEIKKSQAGLRSF